MTLVPVIGLEIHVQLKTQSKMFCSCPQSADGAPPNSAICPVCTGQPGTLPTLNAHALRLGILIGRALGCHIPDSATFDRKNYFYPDLPKGYQISQYDLPVATSGGVEIVTDAPGAREKFTIRITRAHLEEDAAKLIHLPDGTTAVDYNRAGAPLAEIVTEPDFASPAEAKAFLGELRTLLRTIRASDADMEKGQMRCDANVSIRRQHADGSWMDERYNPKVEIKNVNSMRAVERALAYEISRQSALYHAETPPAHNETRGWNEARGVTESQRTKESAEDYRYFPEPDIPLLDLTRLRDAIRVPELPAAVRIRLAQEYALSPADARTLTEDPRAVAYFEAVMSELRAWLEAVPENDASRDELWETHKKKFSKLATGWFLSKLWGFMATHGITMETLAITPENFAEFLTLIQTNKINSSAAQIILADMLLLGKDPSQVMEDKRLGQVESVDELAPIVERIVRENPKLSADYRAGKHVVMKSLIGLVMKATEGRAHPTVTEELLKMHVEQ